MAQSSSVRRQDVHLTWGVCVFVLLAFCIVQSKADSLRIGVSEWMSSDGVEIEDKYKTFVVSSAAQYVIAAKHFNERNTGIVPDLALIQDCPHTVEIVRICDDGGIRLKANLDANEFIQDDGVHALIGYSDTLVAESVSLLAETVDQIPVVSNWAQGNSLSDKTIFPNFARTWPTDEQYLRVTLSLIHQLNYSKLAVLHLNDDSGSAFAQSIVSNLATARITVSRFGFESYNGESIHEAVSLLATAKNNAILCLIYTDDLVDYLADAAVKFNLVDSQLWIFLYMDLNPSLEQFEANQNLTKLMFGSIRLSHLPPVENEHSLFAKYLKDIWPNFGSTELNLINEKLPPFGNENQSICSNSNLNAQVGPTFFQDSIPVGQDISNWPETYDAVLALGFAACQNHLAIPQKRDLYNNLLNVNFTGMSGRVRFDSNGDRAASAIKFILFNWILNEDDGENAQINPFTFPFDSEKSEFILSDKVQFRSGRGMEFLPTDVIIPFHQENKIGSLAILGYFELAVVNVIALACLLWIHQHRKEKLVFNSQPELVALIILGCTIASWSILFLSMEDGTSPIDMNIACHAAPVFFCLGFQVAFIVLIAKTMRIAFLFNNPKLRKRRVVTLKRVLAIVCMIILAELILWIVWTSLFPLKFARVVRFADINGFPLDSIGHCETTSVTSSRLLIIVFTLHALMLLGCAYAANKVKNAPQQYHDAKYIALAVAFLAQTYLVAVPVVVAVYENPLGRYVVLTSVIFLSTMLLLLASVFPKIYMFYTDKELFSFETRSSADPHNVAAVAAESSPSPNGAAMRAKYEGQTSADMHNVRSGQSAVDSMRNLNSG